MISKGSSFYLGRQTILNRRQDICGYELLFRSSDSNKAVIHDNMMATASVIHYAFTELGLNKALGKHKGFINIDQSFIYDELIDLLPSNQIGIELIGKFDNQEKLIERLNHLKNLGFTLTIDDFTDYESNKNILPLADIIKLDAITINEEVIAHYVKTLKTLYPKLQICAKRVGDREQAQRLYDMGIDLFQGFFFGQPEIISGRNFNPSEQAVIKLINLLNDNSDIDNLEKVFKMAPDLLISLLKLVNTASYNKNMPIKSITQAIIMLGTKQLRRWLQVLLFNMHKEKDPFSAPLLQIAAVRGFMLEKMTAAAGGEPHDQDIGFITGILSLINVLTGTPMQIVVQEFHLENIAKDALLNREGVLGQFLSIIEGLEQGNVNIPDNVLSEFPALTPERINKIQSEAIAMADDLLI